jgi:predicted transcriptional regulator
LADSYTCYCMCMLSRRLQILLDDEQYARLESYAKERRLSVGAAVREAIDKAIPSEAARRRAAARAILAAEPMRVGSIEELKKELDEIRGGAHD